MDPMKHPGKTLRNKSRSFPWIFLLGSVHRTDVSPGGDMLFILPESAENFHYCL
ncbi:hypothetical protein B4135_0889 [Caldibacillus debilis]|uniref:Uncharacterized protein n=1 Tax=Caldibacillus debilis TaxID=301148 RepID=A0A150M5U8_9BACI|nr:hypothetical protein B4135_0889 [Caldibacillus debilis]